jgi:hypothetical protein
LKTRFKKGLLQRLKKSWVQKSNAKNKEEEKEAEEALSNIENPG